MCVPLKIVSVQCLDWIKFTYTLENVVYAFEVSLTE